MSLSLNRGFWETAPLGQRWRVWPSMQQAPTEHGLRTSASARSRLPHEQHAAGHGRQGAPVPVRENVMGKGLRGSGVVPSAERTTDGMERG